MTKLHLLFLSILLIPAMTVAATPDKDVIVRVGGIPITSYELQRQIDRVLPLRVSFHGGVSAEKVAKVRQEALDDLIQRGYKIKYAIDNEISIPSATVDAQLEKIKRQFKAEEDFEKAVAVETLAGLRASLYRQNLADEAEKIAVTNRVETSDEEIRAYYDANKHTFFLPKQYRASHILVKVDPASNAEELALLEEKARGLLARAKSGEDFFDLAYYNSDDRTKYVGGDLGMFHEGQTEKPFEEALGKMKVGDISDLVRTRFGFHIIKLTQVNEPRQLSYDEMRLKLKSRLEKERHDKLYAEWIDALAQKYKVERLVE